MKIRSIEAVWVRVPLHKIYEVRSRTYEDSSHIIVRLQTDDGLTGIGEVPAVFTPDVTMAALTKHLGPAVIGMDPRQPDLLHQKMDAALAGHNSAKNGIDVAAYDVVGQALGLPICALLGGQHREAVPVCDAIGLLPPDQVKQAARQLLDSGFKQAKLKAGKDFARDLATVQAVREACGDALQIRMDINMGYRNAAVALPLCQRLEAAGVDILEQPVIAEDLPGMALLAQNLAIPLLAHESMGDIRDAMAIFSHKAADILNVSPPRAGGLYPAIQIVRLAETMNVPVMIAGAMETGPGNAASAHLGAACREQPYPGDARTVLREKYSLLNEPIRIEAGFVHIPRKPGLGYTLDTDAIDKCRKTPWVKAGG